MNDALDLLKLLIATSGVIVSLLFLYWFCNKCIIRDLEKKLESEQK